MRQTINAPVFEGLDQATFTAGMKAKILQPSIWCGNLISLLSPVVRETLTMLADPLLIWGRHKSQK